jgi:hypothetical protein
VAPPAGLRLVPAAQGIDVAGPGVGTGQEIGFGRAQAGAVAAAARVLGEEPGPATVPPGCALTEVAWRRAGLAMTFDGGAFAGWRTGGERAFPGPVQQAGRVCAP